VIKENCFVIMAIGNQNYGDFAITSNELKQKYDDLIKEAILKAHPGLEVTRADEFPMPGTITTDIITRIMFSNFVVADVTYPNANVFYELGLRHASKPGTVIIKDKNGPHVPFDIAHLRYIEYENTASGLKELSERLKQCFDGFERNPQHPDNHFLEMAKLLKFEYPEYAVKEQIPAETQIIMNLMKSPELIDLILRQQRGEEIDEQEMIKALLSNPGVAVPILNSMVNSGDISLGLPAPNRAARRKSSKNK
jgi:hypothetical protein